MKSGLTHFKHNSLYPTIMLMMAITGCSQQNKTPSITQNEPQTDNKPSAQKSLGRYSLVHPKSDDDLLSFVNNAITERVKVNLQYRYYKNVDYAAEATAAGANTSADVAKDASTETMEPAGTDAASGSFSQTNLIEKSVDEADFVKQNASHIFLYTQSAQGDDNKTINIIKKSSTKTVSKLSFNLDAVGEGLYLDKNNVYMLENAEPKQTVWSEKKQRYVRPNVFSRLNIIDIADVTKPKPKNSYTLAGNHKQSRKLNDNLFVVMETDLAEPIQCDGSHIATNKVREFFGIDDPAVKKCIKKYHLNAAELLKRMPKDVSGKTIQSKDCYIPPLNAKSKNKLSWSNTKLTLINKVDLKGNNHETTCVFSSADSFYMSTKAMYFASTNYLNELPEPSETEAAKVSTDMSIAIAQPQYTKTIINKFLLNDDIKYAGAGMVSGEINWEVPSFSMNEYNGVLRIVTSMHGPNGIYNMLHTLAESPEKLALNTLATLPNEDKPKAIGKPHERIKGVRFMSKHGYIVTFRNSDPLYKIDLSDPKDPKMVGELEMLGYSAYLHRINDQYLMGIGYSVDERARPTGIQTTVFDVTGSPKIVAQDTQNIKDHDFKLMIDTDSKALSTLFDGKAFRVTIPYFTHIHGNYHTQTNALEYTISPKTGKFTRQFNRKGQKLKTSMHNQPRFRALMHGNDLYYTTDDGNINKYVWQKR